jgi:hypothetical protein
MMKLLTWSNLREKSSIQMMASYLNLEALLTSWEQDKEEDHLNYNIAIPLRPKKQPTIAL